MNKFLRNRWFQLLLLVTVAALVIAAGCNSRKHQGQIAEQQTYTVGLVTWIGYAPIYVAKDRGFFDEEGIRVDVRTMDQPGAREAAFDSGQLDFFPNTPDAFVILFSEQTLRGKIIAALDQSRGADGIIAKKGIRTVADLKGKSVGFQKGITSHFLLLYFLNKENLSGTDIKQINMGADDAGTAFMSGKLDAAATWEPWISTARQSKDGHVLVDSSEIGDRIVDVLLVSEHVLEDPKAASAFLRAWYKGLELISSHPNEANLIIAKYLQVKVEEVPSMLQTTRFYSQQESAKYLQDRLSSVISEVSDLYIREKIIQRSVNLDDKIDSHVVENNSPH